MYFLHFRCWQLSLTESLFISSACIAFTTVTEEDMHAFSQYACVDRESVDIHCMKSDLGAPEFTSRRGEAGNSKDTFNDSETEV